MEKKKFKFIPILFVLYVLFIIILFIVGGSNMNYLGPMFTYFIFTLPTSFVATVLLSGPWTPFFLFIVGIINTILLFFILRLFKH